MLTKRAMKERITSTLSEAKLDGFTQLLYWKGLHRYIVGMTNNHTRTIDLLYAQAMNAVKLHHHATLGCRKTPGWTRMIDIGTSTDDLSEAMWLWQVYNQQAIWDFDENKEIKVARLGG